MRSLRPLFILLCLVFLFSPLAIAQSDSLISKWRSAISNDQSNLLQEMLADAVSRDAAQQDSAQTEALLSMAAPNGKNALMVACKNGDLELVRRMVLLGASVKARTLTGGTPLMFAVLGNHIPVADWLLSEGADLNAKGSNGWSSATIAGAKGFDQMLAWLVEAGASVDEPDVYRFTPLMRAVDNTHLQAATLLLEKGNVNVNHTDESGNSALHFAVANAQHEMVSLLLTFGASPKQANRDGITPLQMASKKPQLLALFE